MTATHINRIAALGVAAGLFWGVSELAMAPAAQADPYSDIVNNLDTVYSEINEYVTLGDQYLAAGDLTDALDSYLSSVDNTFFAPLENLYVDGIDVLTNTPVAQALVVLPSDPGPSDFADALTWAQGYYDIAQTDFTQATNLLTIGDFSGAEWLEVAGNNALWFEAPNALIVGLSASLFGT